MSSIVLLINKKFIYSYDINNRDYINIRKHTIFNPPLSELEFPTFTLQYSSNYS